MERERRQGWGVEGYTQQQMKKTRDRRLEMGGKREGKGETKQIERGRKVWRERWRKVMRNKEGRRQQMERTLGRKQQR